MNIEDVLKKCLCISIKTKHSQDNPVVNKKKITDIKHRHPTGLSFKYPQNQLEVIYEETEYESENDNSDIKQYIFYS
jgi:hypothetical protein